MFCLDTNVIIFAMNRRNTVIVARLSTELRAGTTLLVPAIVRFELEYGIAKSDRPAASRASLERLMAAGFEQAVFDLTDAREAADIRAHLESQGMPIGPFDNLSPGREAWCRQVSKPTAKNNTTRSRPIPFRRYK